MAPRGAPGPRGTGRRPGRRRAASCRTPSDTTPTDPASPSRSRPATPRAGRRTSGTARRVATSDDVEQLARADVDDLGRPPLAAERALPGEQRLVQPDRRDGAEAVRVVDQRRAVHDDGVHHRVPVTAEIGGHLGHGAAVAADLHRRPPRRPGRHRTAARGDLRVLLGPRPPTRRATPPLLAPHQTGRPAEHRQIDQLDLAHPVTMSDHPATRRRRARRVAITIRSQPGHSPTPTTVTSGRPTSSAHMRVGSVSNRGSSTRIGVRHRQSRGPLCRERGPLPALTPPSDPKRRSSSAREFTDLRPLLRRRGVGGLLVYLANPVAERRVVQRHLTGNLGDLTARASTIATASPRQRGPLNPRERGEPI